MPQDSIHRLNREWERLRLNYGIADSPSELDRLLLKSRRKRARLRDLRARLAAIQSEVEPEIPMPAPPEPAAPQPAEAPSKEPVPQTLNTIVEQGDSTRRRSTLDPR